jgi:hypothetical protein
MASVVDICNMALGLLGDRATVSSIDPPEQSYQAEKCAQYFGQARDAVLSDPDATWSFATRRTEPALLTATTPTWEYGYAVPADLLRAISILPPGASDDYSASFAVSTVQGAIYPGTPPLVGAYTPQPFALESLEDGTRVIWSNQDAPILRYVARAEDPTRWSALFVEALTARLASLLAGPILKGKEGTAMADAMLKRSLDLIRRAAAADARQRNIKPRHSVPWLAGR